MSHYITDLLQFSMKKNTIIKFIIYYTKKFKAFYWNILCNNKKKTLMFLSSISKILHKFIVCTRWYRKISHSITLKNLLKISHMYVYMYFIYKLYSRAPNTNFICLFHIQTHLKHNMCFTLCFSKWITMFVFHIVHPF